MEQNSSGDIQYHYHYRRQVSSVTSTARHHKSRAAAVRFWFRQLTPLADNFRHIRSCRRDLALHFLLPPDSCGASRHTILHQAQKQIPGLRGVVSLRWHTGNNRPLLSFTLSYLLCLLASLAFSFLFLLSLFSFSSKTSTTTMV